jgi:hypothetical protein
VAQCNQQLQLNQMCGTVPAGVRLQQHIAMAPSL